MTDNLTFDDTRSLGLYSGPDTATLVHVAAALAARINHVNRSMGLADIYPFVLSEAAHRKLAFVHDWLRRGAQGL